MSDSHRIIDEPPLLTDLPRLLESFNPATGERLGTVPITAGTYERILDQAVTAARTWRLVPAPQRGELLRSLAAEWRTHQRKLAELIARETGKPIGEALTEIQDAIDTAEFATGQARRLYGRTMPSERPQQRLCEQWHPLGVVGILTAFNFPVSVWAWNACMAVVCGNACVWKPSPRTPLTALAMQTLCESVLQRHRAPPLLQLLIDDDHTLAQRLVADRRTQLISFTGSTVVGRRVAQVVAARLGRSLLELGGNCAVIVDESADLQLATRAILIGALATAGQRCTSIRRVLVHRSQFEPLKQALLHAYRQVRIGDPLDPAVVMGPLIDAGAVRAFEQAVAAARAAGGEVLTGGRVLSGPGHFVEPTVIVARNHWAVVREETFAPVLYLIPVDTLDEAIRQQNDSPYGLSSALFTAQLAAAEQFLGAAGSDCGIANINLGPAAVEVGAAFGGEKDTGGGREAGSDAWKTYMRRQTTTVSWA